MHGFTPLDLDKLSRQELQELRKVLGRLADYCDQRITLLGGIGDEDLCKQRMAEIYAGLPPWAHWRAHKPDMFAPFTDDCKRAILQAEQEASRRGNSIIGTVHLLLGVLAVVSLPGVDMARLRRDAESVTVEGGDGQPGSFTPGGKRAIGLCFEEARREGVNKITPRHMLCALASGEGRAARVLALNGLTPDIIRQVSS